MISYGSKEAHGVSQASSAIMISNQEMKISCFYQLE
jgi:hypothetical protein